VSLVLANLHKEIEVEETGQKQKKKRHPTKQI
jgi:hypothetical protein